MSRFSTYSRARRVREPPCGAQELQRSIEPERRMAAIRQGYARARQELGGMVGENETVKTVDAACQADRQWPRHLRTHYRYQLAQAMSGRGGQGRCAHCGDRGGQSIIGRGTGVGKAIDTKFDPQLVSTGSKVSPFWTAIDPTPARTTRARGWKTMVNEPTRSRLFGRPSIPLLLGFPLHGRR